MARYRTLLVIAFSMLSAQPQTSTQQAAPISVIRGQVVSADADPRPLRGARITVAGSEDDAVFTDGEGRFELRASSSSALRITKAGFAPALMSGSIRDAADLRIALGPGAVLEGIVVDELGFPVTDARVRAEWLNPPAPGAVATEFFTDTDDDGTYRIGSLPPGRYAMHSEPQMRRLGDVTHVLRAEMELRIMEMRRAAAGRRIVMSEVAPITLRSGETVATTLVHRAPAVSEPDAPIAGRISGGVVDEFGEPLQDVTIRLWRLRFAGDRNQAHPAGIERVTDDRGQFRLPIVPPGRYLLVATMEGSPYASLYYPGVTTIANAMPVVVTPRAEVIGISMTFTRSRAARVTGLALNAGGQPLEGTVTLTPSRRSGAISLSPRIVRTAPDGSFEFSNVGPGEYVVRAARPAAGQPTAEFAAQYITIAGPDPAPVVIATSRTATMRGRVVIEGDPAGSSAADVGLMAVPDADAGPIIDRPATAFLTGDAFELHGLAGPMRIALSRAPVGWWLKTVDVASVNAAESPVQLAGPSESRSDVTVVVSTAGATVSGRVADEAGRPVDDYRVIVFSMNRDRWFGGSSYVRLTGGPELDGGFTIRSLPPDDYWIIAVDAIDGDGESGDWQNPDVLASLVTAASRLSVSEGQRATTQLRVIRWGR